jgi:hypothetical protein
MMLPFGLAGAPADWPAAASLAALGAPGVVQTGLAQFLRFIAIRRAGPVFVSIVAYLIPIWAAVLGVAFLGETVTLQAGAAYALILGGILIARDRAGLGFRTMVRSRSPCSHSGKRERPHRTQFAPPWSCCARHPIMAVLVSQKALQRAIPACRQRGFRPEITQDEVGAQIPFSSRSSVSK